MKLSGIKVTGIAYKKGKIEPVKHRQSVSAKIAARKRPKQKFKPVQR